MAFLLLMNLPLTGSVEARNALQLRSAHLLHPPRQKEQSNGVRHLLPAESITVPRLPWDSFGRWPLSVSYRGSKSLPTKAEMVIL